MADPVADNADFAVDELKRKARRRLVGAIVIALAAATILPLLLEQEQKPLGDDVSVQIPPVDGGKFVSRLKADPPNGAAPEGKADSGVIKPGGERATTAAPVAAPEPAAAAPNAEPAAAPSPAPTAVPPPAAPEPASRPAPAPKAAATVPAPAPPARTAAPAAAPPGVTSVATLAGSSAPAPAPAPPGAAADAVPPAATAPAAPPAAAPPPAVAAATGTPGVEGYVVQLGAFTDNYGANALAGKLKKLGYPAFTEPVETSRGTLWRVRVGGYPTRPAANDARNKLKAGGHDGVVTAAK